MRSTIKAGLRFVHELSRIRRSTYLWKFTKCGNRFGSEIVRDSFNVFAYADVLSPPTALSTGDIMNHPKAYRTASVGHSNMMKWKVCLINKC